MAKISVKIDATKALKFYFLGMEAMFLMMNDFTELERLLNLYKICLSDEH